jgi:hypothetical protein
MRSPVRPFGVILAVFGFALSALPLEAETFFSTISWSVHGTVLFFPEDNGLNSDPMPILPSLGAAAAFPILGPLAAEVSLDFYGTHYGYSYDLGRAVPYAIENRSSLVIGSVLGIQLLGRFFITPNIAVRVFAGPAADLRICLIAEDLKGDDREDASKQTKDITKYFWGMGRWLLPVAGAGIDFGITPKVMLGLDARVWFPLYKAWSGESLPAVEGWRFGVGFKVTLR